MFELNMTALRQTAKQSWLTANPANPANVANPIATGPKSGWLTPANLANAGEKAAQQPKTLATLASVSHWQFDTVAIEKPQISQISQLASTGYDLLTTRLLAAAMRRCDQFNDGDQARADMRQDVLATPLHLQQDLLDYFNEATRGTKQ